MTFFLGGLLLIIAVAGVWIFWRPLRPKDPTHYGGGSTYDDASSHNHHSSSHDGPHDS